jgi:hypothetical protein
LRHWTGPKRQIKNRLSRFNASSGYGWFCGRYGKMLAYSERIGPEIRIWKHAGLRRRLKAQSSGTKERLSEDQRVET